MPTRSSKTVEKLLEAMDRKSIVRFSRPFEGGTYTGFVLDIGKTFFLFASLDEGLAFERYSCIRIADARSLRVPATYESFYKAVRKKRKDKLPAKISVDLNDAKSVLQTLHPSTVTIYRERVSPDTCIIGRTTSDNGVLFEFLEVGPDAVWETEPSYYRLNQITRVDLPGPYEKALLLVAGEPKFKPGTFE